MTERVLDLAGPKGYEHNWIYVGGPGLPLRNPYRGGGGKSRRQVVESPKLSRTKAGIPKRAGGHEIEPRAAVRMKAAELRGHQARGSRVAEAELNRRAAKRPGAANGPTPAAAKADTLGRRADRLTEKQPATAADAEKAGHAHMRAAEAWQEAGNAPGMVAHHEKRAADHRKHANRLNAAAGVAPGRTVTPQNATPAEAHAKVAELDTRIGKVTDVRTRSAEAFAASRDAKTPAEHAAAAKLHRSVAAESRAAGVPGAADIHDNAAARHEAAKPKRKPSSTYLEYQAAKQEQDRRFEDSRDGYRSKGKGKSAEELAYFGEGEHMGNGVEKRVTYKSFLAEKAAGNAHERQQAATYKHARDLGIKHAQQSDTSQHDAEYNTASEGHDEQTFGGGYTDGLIAGEAAKSKRGPSAREQKVAAAAERDKSAATEVRRRQQASADAARARDAANRDAADKAVARYARDEYPRPSTDAEHAERAAVQNKARAMHYNDETAGRLSTADLDSIIGSRFASENDKARARKLRAAKSKGDAESSQLGSNLSAMSDEKFAQTLTSSPLGQSKLTQGQKRVIAAEARRRLEARRSGAHQAANPLEAPKQGGTPTTGDKVQVGDRIHGANGTSSRVHRVEPNSAGGHTLIIDNGGRHYVPKGETVHVTTKAEQQAAADAHEARQRATYARTPGATVLTRDNPTAVIHPDGRVTTPQASQASVAAMSDAELQRAIDSPTASDIAKGYARRELSKRAAAKGRPGPKGDAGEAPAADITQLNTFQLRRALTGSNDAHARAAEAELQRRARERTAEAVKAETSGPGPVDRRPPPPGAGTLAERPGIRVEHSGDGTVVYGTERGDTAATAALKEQGFKWSRNLDGWYLPRSWGEATRDQRVKALQSKLGDRVAVQRGDLAKSGTAAEQQAARVAAAERNAETNTQRAARARAEAEAQFQRSHDATAGIPFGQPILVGHHSQRRHENAIAKSHAAMRRGVDASAEAGAREERAASAAARARMETDPRAAARRLDRNEAEHRKIMRSLQATPAGEHHDRLDAMRRDLEAKNEADRATVAAAGNGLGKDNVKPGDVVVIKGQAHVVTGTGSKNVKVLTSVGHLPYPYHQVQGHKSYADLTGESTARLEALIESSGAPETYKAQARAIISKRKG